MLESLVSSRH